MASVTGTPRMVLLKMLRETRPAIGTFVLLKGVRAAQAIAHTGVDTVVVDCEHGNVSDSDMHDMVAAIAGSSVSPVVRIASSEATYIKRALDTGAHGILVPMVSSADQARLVVASSKFPPAGVRGQGSLFAYLEHGLSTPSEYVATANDSIVIMVQIETAAGVANIEEICQVEGIDLLFIGPKDLAMALLGYAPAQGTEPVFVEAVDKILATAKRYGKKVGITAMNGESAKRAKERFDLVLMSGDIRAMHAWYKNELQLARS